MEYENRTRMETYQSYADVERTDFSEPKRKPKLAPLA